MEPCGTPNKSISKELSPSFIFAPCFINFKYEYTNVTASSDKAYA